MSPSTAGEHGAQSGVRAGLSCVVDESSAEELRNHLQAPQPCRSPIPAPLAECSGSGELQGTCSRAQLVREPPLEGPRGAGEGGAGLFPLPTPTPGCEPFCAPSLARTSGGQDCPAHRWGNRGWGGRGRAVSGQAWPTQAKSRPCGTGLSRCVCVRTRVCVDWSPARRQVEQRPQPASWAPQGTRPAGGMGRQRPLLSCSLLRDAGRPDLAWGLATGRGPDPAPGPRPSSAHRPSAQGQSGQCPPEPLNSH